MQWIMPLHFYFNCIIRKMISYFRQTILTNVALEKFSPFIVVLPVMPPRKPRFVQSDFTTSDIISAPQVPGSKTYTTVP